MHELICTCYIHLDSFVFTCILFFPLYVVFYYVTLLYLKCSIVLRVRIKDDDDDSACVKYLGHFICSDLSDDTDILRQRRCLTIQGNILLRKFHMCSIGVRLALFRSFCSPMYTSQLWWNYKKCTMKRLLITYHNVFKMSISMSKYESTSVLCNVLCCQAVIRNLVYRFMCRLQASNNSLVMSIQSSSLVYMSRIRKHWRRLLYVYG